MNKTQAKAIILETVRVIPSVLPYLSERTRAALKAGYVEGGVPEINARYNKEIVSAMTTYFEGGAMTAPRNQFRQAMTEAFNSAMDTGFIDGGQALPLDEDAAAWLDARLSQEVGFIDVLFQEIKELRGDSELDYFKWVTFRADNYTRTLREIYNAARLRATKDKMVTFLGDDGKESCDTCQSLKGKRHKISWFVKRNYIPPFGIGLECHPGRRCEHYLEDDEGNIITV